MKMKTITHEVGDAKIVEITSDKILINNLEEGLNLMAEYYYQGFDKIILHQKNITPLFFDLKTRLAGDLLQKFTQYNMRLAIVGDFSTYDSNSLQAFILESNKGRQVNFVARLEDALQ